MNANDDVCRNPKSHSILRDFEWNRCTDINGLNNVAKEDRNSKPVNSMQCELDVDSSSE